MEVRSREAYDLGPDAYANALLVDPFSLGGPPPPQLSLRGLTLPFSTSVGPKLDISRVSEQQVIITWPTNAVEYTLESATDLSATLWDDVTITPVVLGDQFVVVDDITTARKFYRLRKP